MSAILKFDFQQRRQLRFSAVNYLKYKKRPNFTCDNYISLKQGETTSNPHSPPLKGDFIEAFQTILADSAAAFSFYEVFCETHNFPSVP